MAEAHQVSAPLSEYEYYRRGQMLEHRLSKARNYLHSALICMRTSSKDDELANQVEKFLSDCVTNP